MLKNKKNTRPVDALRFSKNGNSNTYLFLSYPTCNIPFLHFVY